MRTPTRFASAILSGLLLLSGCHNNPSPPAPAPGVDLGTPDPRTNWALISRAYDDAGLSRQDKRTLTAPDDIRQLKSYFPDMSTAATSNVHGAWSPLMVIQFHTADGADVYVVTDYRLYRIGDSSRGDFVVRPGFADYMQRLFIPGAAGQ